MVNKQPILPPSLYRFLQLLKTKGPQSSAAVAQQLAITHEGARFQLTKLAQDGYVLAQSVAKGVGRPQQIWKLTAKGNEQFADTHADLAIQFLESIEEVLGQEAMQQVLQGRERGAKERYAEQLVGITGLEEKIARFSEIRKAEGYLAEWFKDEEGYVLIEHHCPIHSAAKKCDGLCLTDLHIIQHVLGEYVSVTRTSHIMAGDEQCAYRVRLLTK